MAEAAAIVVQGEHPAIDFHGHQAAADFQPGLFREPAQRANALGDVSENLIGLAGCQGSAGHVGLVLVECAARVQEGSGGLPVVSGGSAGMMPP